MNILHLSRMMSQGGAQKIVYQLATGCKKRGHHIVVVSSGGEYVKMLREASIPHYEICDLECKNVYTMWKTLRSLIQIIKKEKIEILHTHHRMASVYGTILKMIFPKLQLVYTAHNVFYNKRLFTRFGLSRTAIIAVGNNVKLNLIEYFSVNPEKIQVIYNAVERGERGAYNSALNEWKKKDEVLIGLIGRLSKQKGVDVFLAAFYKAKKKEPCLKGVIIGDGEMRAGIERTILRMGLQEDIFMMGYQREVTSLIEQLDFAVMPSRWEGFPLTPIELFSVGKTLVGSDIGGINEIVQNDINGILVPKDDSDAFAEAILDLVNDKEKRKRMERAGMEYYNRYVDYNEFMEEYISVYDRLIRESL